jgi:hypothetical protein
MQYIYEEDNQYVWVRLAWQVTFKSSTFWYVRAGKGLICLWTSVRIVVPPVLISWLIYLFFTFHSSKSGNNNPKDIEIVMLINISNINP